MTAFRDPPTRIAGADASNLFLERPGQTFAIGLVGLLDTRTMPGGAGREGMVGRVRAALGPRVAALPALNRRVVTHGRRMSWVTTEVDLGSHIHSGGQVDGLPGLARFSSALMDDPLPRDRPLWDVTMVTGVGPDTAGLVLRVHHAVADGVSGLELLAALVDPGEDPPQQPASGTGPSLHPLARWWLAARASLHTAAALAHRVPSTSLLGPRGARLGVALVAVDLTPLHERAHRAGVSINDLLLAAVASATHTLLSSRGEPSGFDLPVSVPVSLHGPADTPGRAANQVGIMIVRLPMGELDPWTRVRLIAAATAREKPMAHNAGTLGLSRSRAGTRIMDRLSRHQHAVAMFVTNVHGPTRGYTLAGVPVTAAWPLTMIAGNVRLAVAALSYAGRLAVSVIYDAASCPDVDAFADALGEALGAPLATPGSPVSSTPISPNPPFRASR